MFAFTAFVQLLALFIVLPVMVRAPPPPPTPSPSTCYACPYEDTHGTNLGDSDKDNGSLVCYYPRWSQPYKTYTCKYSANSGALTKDNDNGRCPSKARSTICGGRKRKFDNLEAVRRSQEARAANPQLAAELPTFVGKKKRTPKASS